MVINDHHAQAELDRGVCKLRNRLWIRRRRTPKQDHSPGELAISSMLVARFGRIGDPSRLPRWPRNCWRNRLRLRCRVI